MMLTRILFICLLPAVLARAFAAEESALPFFDAKDLTPVFEGTPQFKQLHPAQVTKLKLVNQDGQAVTEASLKGHLSLINFFFTSCGYTCPMMMQSLQKLRPELERFKGLRVYSLSVTPETDTPPVLKSYARTRSLDLSAWDLLTGERAEIFHIGNDLFRANRQIGKVDPSSFTHTENLYLVDRERRIRGIYKALDKDSLKLLIRDLAALEAPSK